MNTTLEEEYLSVAEAAAQIKVSQSTIWRWIDRGVLPAYRVGQRRIRLKKNDVLALITPARKPQQGRGIEEERARLSRPLTDAERRQALAALEAAEQMEQGLLERRGGVPFAPSWKDLNRARAERSRQLRRQLR